MSSPHNFMTTRRKLAISTWSAPSEGNIFGKLTINATALQAFIATFREQTGLKLSVTHLVGKAVALALRRAPGLNGRIFLGRFIPHETIDISFLVALEDGADLSRVKVERADELSLVDLAKKLGGQADLLRKGKDPDFEKTKGVLRALPTFLIRPLVKLTGFLGGAMGLDLKFLGVEKFPFGSCMITSVGMFGIDEGYAPFTPFARVPILVTIASVRDVVVAVNGVPTVQPQLVITATIDHRFVDGFALGILARTAKELLENPHRLMEQ